jgi:hypothetical protein
MSLSRIEILSNFIKDPQIWRLRQSGSALVVYPFLNQSTLSLDRSARRELRAWPVGSPARDQLAGPDVWLWLWLGPGPPGPDSSGPASEVSQSQSQRVPPESHVLVQN